MNRVLTWSLLLLLAAFSGLTACTSSDDDDELTGNNVEDVQRAIIGTWQFVEMLDGPGASFETHRGARQPDPHTLKFTKDGKAIYLFEDGFSHVMKYAPAEHQEWYYTDLMVIELISFSSDTDNGHDFYPIPYGVEVSKRTLKLHYEGIYTTDHIRETLVYKRIQ